jgi:hypothetical protein
MPPDDSPVTNYSLYTLESETANTEPIQDAMDCTEPTVYTNSHIPLHMCDADIAHIEAKYDIPYTGVCLKHEQPLCDDDIYPPGSPLMTAGGDESRDDKPHKCMHCVK